MTNPKKYLIVDDDEIFRSRLDRALSKRGFISFSAANYEEALQIAKTSKPDFAVVDLRMPGKSGLNLIEALKEELNEIKIVLLTGFGSIATAVEAIQLGAVNVLTKPADVDEILASFDTPEEIEKLSEIDQVPSLARTEWEHINRVVTLCEGNITKAAKMLGIHRRSLQRKLAKYPLPQ